MSIDYLESFLAFESNKDVEIKDYRVILNGKEPFYEIPIKNKEETYKAITELIRDVDFTTGNFLDYKYFDQYKIIGIDLSKQKNDLENQQINFVGKLEQDAVIFYVIKEKHQNDLEFSQNSLSIV